MGASDDDLDLYGEDAPAIDADPELLQAFRKQQMQSKVHCAEGVSQGRRKRVPAPDDVDSSATSLATTVPIPSVPSVTIGTERHPSPERPPVALPPPPTTSTESTTAPGSRFGLQSAQQLKEDQEQRQAAQRRRLQAMDPDRTGRDAETVYRSKTGKASDSAALKAEEAARRRRAEEEAMQQMEWGKGRVQKREQEEARRKFEEEKLKPLARYADDADINAELKERDRWGDPLAQFGAGGGSSKRKKGDKAPRRPVYQGTPAPPNRFGIAPGFRWDGVDRSNGFEKEMFMQQNSRKASAARSYATTVDD
ncbi:Pre-mRNA-splicing factor cwc26 [Tieghemiomyces parasiticus]|uniref:Pre-mRNA-splicing factor cwc26 n=1 Tax=Tieghemiomyces parasiticus TaxID=78921 RepID=A0A9W8ADM2_9FUNG|nr:Pre-mRNA-splicing factor cwc26 [Tieghemiomyces parasiticus]